MIFMKTAFSHHGSTVHMETIFRIYDIILSYIANYGFWQHNPTHAFAIIYSKLKDCFIIFLHKYYD